MRYDDRSDQSLPADGPRSGVHAILKRFERRVPATYRLAYDHTAPAIPRLMARALSNYERAGSREVILILFDTLPVFDGPLLWVARRGIFAMAGRPRGDDDPTLDMAVPASGWVGNLLALGCWVSVLTGLWLLVTG